MSNKYIDPTGKILAHTDRIEAWRKGEKAAPINVEWDLSNRCSLACKDCHFAYTHTRGPLAGTMIKPEGGTSGGDLAPVEMVKKALREMKEAGVLSVTWTGGGEPTLHPAFDEIVSYAAEIGLKQGMYTSGVHINQYRGMTISRVMDWIVVSLDAASAEDYRNCKGFDLFERAKAGAGYVINGGGNCKVGISFLLDEGNYRNIESMMDTARSIGADYSTFRPKVDFDITYPAYMIGDRSWVDEAMELLGDVSSAVNDVEYLPARFIDYRDWQSQRPYEVCYGIRFSATVTPNGKVWVCPNRREFPDSYIGDLSIESFSEIWARHPGEWTDLEDCRALCRLHMTNRTLWSAYKPREHAEFI